MDDDEAVRGAPEVFRRVVDEADVDLHERILSKSTLVALSHELEDVLLDHDLPGTVFAAFQEARQWEPARERFEMLAEAPARSVTVLAAGELHSADDGIARVRLPHGDPLVDEWFLVVLAQGFSAVLMAGDLARPHDREGDRQFASIVAMDPAAVVQLTHGLAREVARVSTETSSAMLAALQAWPPGPPNDRYRDLAFAEAVSAVERRGSHARAAEAALQTAADELHRLDRMKDTFLSLVTHELRNPMTVVNGMAETLQQSYERMSEDQRRRAITALATQAGRLQTMLSELVDVDRMVRGVLSIEPEPVDVAEIVRYAVEHSGIAERIDVVAPAHLVARIDRVQLDRIVANLLANVAKYAPEGPVAVLLSEHDGALRLTVTDRGPGIAEDERERVFEPFHRIDHAHVKPGTGVGLALVGEFARLHGGSAHVEEPIGGGTRVVIQIPEIVRADGS